jgi:hypothetical protein
MWIVVVSPPKFNIPNVRLVPEAVKVELAKDASVIESPVQVMLLTCGASV